MSFLRLFGCIGLSARGWHDRLSDPQKVYSILSKCDPHTDKGMEVQQPSPMLTVCVLTVGVPWVQQLLFLKGGFVTGQLEGYMNGLQRAFTPQVLEVRSGVRPSPAIVVSS